LPQLADDVEKQAKAILGDDKFNKRRLWWFWWFLCRA
jgi:hypothetical protein